MFKKEYSQSELLDLVRQVGPRRGWDFSRMSVVRQVVPWEYPEVVRRYLTPEARVLDIGTGGGEQIRELAPYFGEGVGVDIDPDMIGIASLKNGESSNLTFLVSSEKLLSIEDRFDIILNRHAPFDLSAIRAHLLPDGYFITQQVGERNMENIKTALGQSVALPTVSRDGATSEGITVVAFRRIQR